MSATTTTRPTVGATKNAARQGGGGVLNRRRGTIATVAMAVLALAWLFPLLWSLYNSFRDYPHLEARLRQQVSPEEADLLVRALMRRDTLDATARINLFKELTEHFREKVEFPDGAVLGITDEQYLRNTVDSVFRGKRL